MTLQIGIVGSDGIILASDRLVNSPFDNWGVARTPTSKFHRSDRVACCWSGDRCAEYAAKFISESKWDEPVQMRDIFEDCGNRAWAVACGDSKVPRDQVSTPKKVLIAASEDCTLWELDVYKVSIASPMPVKAMAGDQWTTITHLLNNYIPASPRSPIGNLIGMAAYMIYMGHKENSAGIDGLELAIIRKGESPVFLSGEQERELERLSQSAYESISEILLQRFEFTASRT